MTESTNRAGQALDLEALEKLISPLADFTHHDECGVREKLEALASRMFEDNQTYWAGKVSDIAKTLPPNPKGREPIEIKVTFDRKLQFGPMMEWSQIEIPDGVRYFREIEVPKGREQEEGGEHNGQHF